MQYYRSRLEEREKDKLYQVYISEALRSINNILAKTLGGGKIKSSYIEILKEIEDNTNAEEAEQAGNEKAEQIINNIQNKLSRLQGGEC